MFAKMILQGVAASLIVAMCAFVYAAQAQPFGHAPLISWEHH